MCVVLDCRGLASEKANEQLFFIDKDVNDDVDSPGKNNQLIHPKCVRGFCHSSLHRFPKCRSVSVLR